ncbi:biotin synthase BioB [bacterium]|nr:biotin synthase BioB [bacterium]
MENKSFYKNLVDTSLRGDLISPADALKCLSDSEVDWFTLLNAAFEVRQYYWGRSVAIHIINNAQNGHCPEDCNYCAQARTSEADIEDYPIKDDSEILDEARRAYEAGAFRYCMVFAGRGPNAKRVERLAGLIAKIKSNYPIEVCVSAGLMNQEATDVLKRAGLDRLNHNLNTSQSHYPKICSTHSFEDRLTTLKAAQRSGIGLCSGAIFGMGESPSDVIEVAYKLRDVGAVSIPVNFLLPIPGTTLKTFTPLSPEYCLRILSLFRLINPSSELRVAAGREIHLRQLQAFSLFPANSLFMEGYLNTTGNSAVQTLQMIKDAGFSIDSTHELDDLLGRLERDADCRSQTSQVEGVILKQLRDLRPSKRVSGCS